MAETTPLRHAGPITLAPAGRARPSRPDARAARTRAARVLAWLPAATVTAFTAAVVLRYGVSVRDLLCFCAYLVACVALPGTLLVRALYRGRRTVAEEIALGVALGYVAEVLAYVAARAAGAPLLVLLWPAVTYAACAAFPRLRGRGAAVPRATAPLWWSWFLALTVASLVAWSAVTFFRHTALTWPLMAVANVDLPYHLALVGELKNHMPPTVPLVAGEPLLYHWFVYAHYAAASWITGIEPLVLLFRLGMLPVLAALVVLLAMVARRVARSRAAVAATLAGTFFMATPQLYAGPGAGVFTWRVQSWTSPSQTFGALLLVPVVLLVIEALEPRGRPVSGADAGRWILLGVFLVGVMGAKATQLPLLAAGLAAAGAAALVRRRAPSRALLAAAGMTAACLLYAQFVLFGGARNGIVVDPLSLMRTTWGQLTGQDEARAGTAALLGVTLLYVLCWATIWFGVLGLLGRSRALTRPGVLVMLGMGLSGLGAVLVFGHCLMSQIYFLAGGYPYLVITAVHGLSLARRRARLPYRAVAVAAGSGVLIGLLVRALCGVRVPLAPGLPQASLYLPYAAAAAAVTVVAVVLAIMRWSRARRWAFIVFMVTGLGLPFAWAARALSGDAGDASSAPGGPVPVTSVPAGALDAARWLRAHSGPDDLVATNAHCRWGYESPCDNRHMWLAALAERRVLVEGWTYTPSNNGRWRPGLPIERIPFWDEERLRLNDAAFRDSASSAIGLLRSRYGVRWLVLERRRGIPEPRAGEWAKPVYRSADYLIYRVV
ncbi:hypothetical protein [Microbispora sp. H13382]|uniref:hypothetical protein n=1 Tax=Microbispora sp. H13382 TaxID=2729112 RepID=UPI00160384C1|nr:hypothetical protein [Microbispora sp. H13382]